MIKENLKKLWLILMVAAFGWAFLSVTYCQEPQYQRVVVISDLHYPYKYLKIKDSKKIEAILAAKSQALQEINTWNDVEEVVFDGDLVAQDGSAKEYAKVIQFLSGFHQPSTYLVGNHEYLYRDLIDPEVQKSCKMGDINSRAERLERFRAAFGNKDLYFSKRVGRYLLVYLACDRLDTEFVCEMSAKQVEWFRNVLSANRKTPTIVFYHAPLANTMANSKLEEKAEAQPEKDIQAILRDNRQVMLWVSGHTHTNPGDPSFNAKENWYEGRVLNVYNGTWDTLPVCTNSLYLYPDKVAIRTYNHETHQWLVEYDRTVAVPSL